MSFLAKFFGNSEEILQNRLEELEKQNNLLSSKVEELQSRIEVLEQKMKRLLR